MSTLVERTEKVSDERLRAAHDDAKIRLEAINQALEEDDLEDKTLRDKCRIESKQQVKSTKTRQTVIARPSKSLVVHFNRSVFDEYAGRFVKNYSKLWFPEYLDLSSWCLGSAPTRSDNTTENIEEWLMYPSQSLVASSRRQSRLRGPLYRIKGVVTHEGHHEDGHYICYRKQPVQDVGDEKPREQWWRLSDSQVRKAAEEEVFGQKSHEAVFMLFYECVDEEIKLATDVKTEKLAEEVVPVATEKEEVKPEVAADTVESAIDLDLVKNYISDFTSNMAAVEGDSDNEDDVKQASVAPPPQQHARKASIDESTTTTTASESDIDVDESSQKDVPYQPVQPIVIAPYVRGPNERSEQTGKAMEGAVKRSSVMV